MNKALAVEEREAKEILVQRDSDEPDLRQVPKHLTSMKALGPKTLILGPFTNPLIKKLANKMLPHAQEYDIRVSSNLRILGSFLVESL